MQPSSNMDVISKLNGTICRLGDSVDSLRAELNSLKSKNTDLKMFYKQKLESVTENKDAVYKGKKECLSKTDDKDNASLTNLQYDITDKIGDVNITLEQRVKLKRKYLTLEPVITIKEDGDIMLNQYSKKSIFKEKVHENKKEIKETDSLDFKVPKKKSKYPKMKPLIIFDENIARERLQSIKKRINALTEELPVIETSLEFPKKSKKMLRDDKNNLNSGREFTTYQPSNYSNQHSESTTTWKEQKIRIRDKLRAGTFKLDFKGSNLSKIIGYGESINNH